MWTCLVLILTFYITLYGFHIKMVFKWVCFKIGLVLLKKNYEMIYFYSKMMANQQKQIWYQALNSVGCN